MSKKEKPFYNIDYLSTIFILCEEKKYKKAFERYRRYLENFPYDLTANVNFADLLIKLGHLEEAKTILEKIKKFSNYPGGYQTFINHILLKLFCAEGNYSDAYVFLKEHSELLAGKRNDANFLFICKQINAEVDLKKDTYLFQQILDYNEDAFIEQARKHQIGSMNENYFIFSENFSIKDVYYQIRKFLPNENRILASIYADSYYFKYDNCGYRKDRNTDYFTAVVLHDSNKIITMYPSPVEEVSADFINLNPYFKKEEKEYTRTKRMSQIEKFNQKYGK